MALISPPHTARLRGSRSRALPRRLQLDLHQVEWRTLDDGHEALLVDGGGIDGGPGAFFANAGEDVHAVGSIDALVPGCVGCVVIKPDRSRYLARVERDPLAEQ